MLNFIKAGLQYTPLKSILGYGIRRTTSLVNEKLDRVLEENIEKEMHRIHGLAIQKFRDGVEKYGPYDPDGDDRSLSTEAISELVDVINYAAMLIIKLERISLLTLKIEEALGRAGETRRL